MRKHIQDPIAVIAGIRTPFAKAFGALSSVSAVKLGRAAVTASIQRAGLQPSEIDEVIIGNVSGPPDAANVARVIALESGVPDDRIAHTVNRNCASGMESILTAMSSILNGRAATIVAGGTESMSQIPLLVHPDAAKIWAKLARAKTLAAKVRAFASFRPRHFKPIVGIELGLTDPVSGMNMGQTAELLADEYLVSRMDQDLYAVESHRKASEAQNRCFLSGEITAVENAVGITIDKDDGIRHEQSPDQLTRLRPIFASDGTVTAGNSCQLTDGAAALVLTDINNLDRFTDAPLGYVTGYAIAGCDPRRMGLGPVYATAKLLRQTGLKLNDFELVEINEAFAAQVIACERAMKSSSFATRELSMPKCVGDLNMDRINPNGGAIALGHPVGTTGTRLVLTLLRALREQNKRRGLATLCVGGGQGVAIMVETELEKTQ